MKAWIDSLSFNMLFYDLSCVKQTCSKRLRERERERGSRDCDCDANGAFIEARGEQVLNLRIYVVSSSEVVQ